MRISGWLAAASALAIAAASAAAQGLSMPLPAKTDIPETFATALCPDAAAGQTMMSDYLVAGPSFADPAAFLAGLEATGCAYDNGRVGDITIGAVIERRQVQPGETFILYRGTTADGTTVIGLVHEEGNNDHPRTPLEQWMAYNTMDGTITVDEGERGAFSCPTAAAAVVDAIGAVGGAEAQFAALEATLLQQSCVAASGAFQIAAVHQEANIDGGFEAEEVWTALSATDQTGHAVSLLYDASPFR